MDLDAWNFKIRIENREIPGSGYGGKAAVRISKNAANSRIAPGKTFLYVALATQEKEKPYELSKENISYLFTSHLYSGMVKITFLKPDESIAITSDSFRPLVEFTNRIRSIMNDEVDSKPVRVTKVACEDFFAERQPTKSNVDIYMKKMMKEDCCGILNDGPKTKLYQNLTVVSLEGKKLTDLPHEFSSLPLVSLNLQNNLLGCCRRWYFFEFAPLRDTLKYLDLSYNEISKFPAVIVDMKNLMDFNISNNKLIWLPVRLALLPNLLHLNVSWNELCSIPKDVVRRPYTTINITNNRLNRYFDSRNLDQVFPKEETVPRLKDIIIASFEVSFWNQFRYPDCPIEVLEAVRWRHNIDPMPSGRILDGAHHTCEWPQFRASTIYATPQQGLYSEAYINLFECKKPRRNSFSNSRPVLFGKRKAPDFSNSRPVLFGKRKAPDL